MGQGYADHLVMQEADIPKIDRVQWRKIDAQLCSGYGNQLILRFCFIFGPTKHALNFGIRRKGHTRMISNVFIRWLLLLSMSDNKTWIYLLILARLPLLRRNS